MQVELAPQVAVPALHSSMSVQVLPSPVKPALHAQVKLPTDHADKVYAFVRASGTQAVVVVTNFGDAPLSVRYDALSMPGAYTDWFSKSAVSLAVSDTIDVPAHGYRVLVR